MTKNKQNLFLFVTFVALLIDQVSKFFVKHFLVVHDKLDAISGVLSLEKIYNSGAAFNILDGNTILLALIAMSTVLLIFLLVFKDNSKINNMEAVAFALISGGALGNLVDRLLYLHVIDFIQIDFTRFPVFNFADIFINIGVILIVLNLIFGKNDD